MNRSCFGIRLRFLFAAGLAVGLAAPALHAQGFERQQFAPTTGTASMRAGAALAIEGDLLAMGAPADDTTPWDSGAVFVFRRDPATDTWSQEQEILPSDPEAYANFGYSVAVSGDVLVVGAPYEDNARGADAGSVYVFRYNSTSHTWAQEQKLLASVGIASDHFGFSVGVSGNLLIGGAPQSDLVSIPDAGSAYVFRYQNSIVKWVEEKRLTDSAAASSNSMGASMIVKGNDAFISSPLTDLGFPNYDAGVVLTYSYSGGTWTQGATITAATPVAYSEFGDAMDLSGDLLAIGAPKYDAGGGIYDSGAVYVLRKNGSAWSEEALLTPPVPSSSQWFGNDVAINGSTLAIGSLYDDPFGKGDSGSIWIAREHKGDWMLDQNLGASDAAYSDHLGVQVVLTGTNVLAAAEGKDTAGGYDWGAIYVYPRADMNLAITPSSPPPGTDVTFSAFYGDPGNPCMITIEDAGGVPTFIPVLIFGFGSDHALTFTATTPPSALGASIGFRSYRISPLGPIVRSDLVYLNL